MKAAAGPCLPVVVSMGDPTGIGPEVTLRALAQRPRLTTPVVLVGDPGVYEATALPFPGALPAWKDLYGKEGRGR